jgi:hypothetical protein
MVGKIGGFSAKVKGGVRGLGFAAAAGIFENGGADFSYADLRICLSEVPKDLQFSFEARESGSAAGLSEMRE